ncbi:MAG: 4-hydroxy-tetrahydrodipicolinate synthase [Rhodospirillales bacterium]
MLSGSIVALVTPFKDGAFDEATYRDLIAWQIASGTNGIVPCGTTGEASTLDHDEHRRVIEVCVAEVAGRVPVIPGTGSNCTAEAVELTQFAAAAGADAALVVAPYYNKPNQEGLYQHFKAIHDASDIPIIIYNIPGRCVVDMTVETMARLAELPRIRGVKDATQDLLRPLRTRAAIGEGFCQLSGEDGTVVAFLASGGHGCISVTANVAPALCAELHRAWQAGDAAKALEVQMRLLPLHQELFCETNPVPAKYALHRLNRCSPDVRLPLAPLAAASRARVDGALAAVQLL